MIIVSRIIHVKVDRRLNVTNKFIYQRRLSSRLAIVMFRGTPCIWYHIVHTRGWGFIGVQKGYKVGGEGGDNGHVLFKKAISHIFNIISVLNLRNT